MAEKTQCVFKINDSIILLLVFRYWIFWQGLFGGYKKAGLKGLAKPNVQIFLKNKKEISKTEIMEREPRKEIINGKIYDTSKATEICVFEIGPCAFAILFKTEKENFFAQQFGKLYEVTEVAAKSILAKYPEKYIEIFGEVEEA